MNRIEFYFKETAAGIRRNGILAFAAMSTAFIALFLFGLALIIARELNLVIEAYTGNVQVAVYLDDPVRPDTVTSLQQTLQALPAVKTVDFEDKQAGLRPVPPAVREPAVDHRQRAVRRDPGVAARDAGRHVAVPASDRGARRAYPTRRRARSRANRACGRVEDYRDLLDRLSAVTRVLSLGIFSVAVIMLVSAVVLVANTLRMGMFARRKEIGIMRLVGATNWRIRVPFLIEGLVESLVGATLAIIGLFLVKVLVIDQLRGKVAFLPLIRNGDVLAIAPFILLAAVAVAVIAGTIGIRRFLDV